MLCICRDELWSFDRILLLLNDLQQMDGKGVPGGLGKDVPCTSSISIRTDTDTDALCLFTIRLISTSPDTAATYCSRPF